MSCDAFNTELTDEQKVHLKQVLSAVLVTGPLNNGDPFPVAVSDTCEEEFNKLDGTSFTIQTFKIEPTGSGAYKLHFYASNVTEELVFEFKGRLRYMSEPYISVKKSKVYPNRRKWIGKSFE